MHKLEIHNFGPLRHCDATLDELVILIGPQSSGKSTVSKLFFFFLHIRDEYVKFLLNSTEKKNTKYLSRDFSKLIRKRFIEFWGPTPQGSDLKLKYQYSEDVFIEIQLDSARHRYIEPIISDKIENSLIESYSSLKSGISRDKESSNLFNSASAIANEISDSEKVNRLINTSKELFNFDEELLFIPAGRSLLSTLSDQLQYIHPHQLDYPMRSFIERINNTKSFFGKSLDDIIREKQLLGEGEIWFSATRKVANIIKRILKGEYIHDKDGGKLYISKNSYTKINFASSGQQESIWILLSLFLVVLEKVKVQIFIEEPEAHLFPVAQKEVVELISFLHASMKTKFVLTTHSPYILSAINNHIYANELSRINLSETSSVINKNMWIDFDKVSGHFVNNGSLTDLADNSLKMLKTEIIDTASDLVNDEYDKLFDIDVRAQQND
ncbi:AAA family ATPase [Endozoicomonas sp. 4G]|uniref:AAA family ATPase n=1 Tax=Endozoicomonas sp. 4G TaxID=2872754 RepID=UPI00207854F6|nr:AAA family ATPase [Endozoicomonas sp. 4G]